MWSWVVLRGRKWGEEKIDCKNENWASNSIKLFFNYQNDWQLKKDKIFIYSSTIFIQCLHLSSSVIRKKHQNNFYWMLRKIFDDNTPKCYHWGRWYCGWVFFLLLGISLFSLLFSVKQTIFYLHSFTVFWGKLLNHLEPHSVPQVIFAVFP